MRKVLKQYSVYTTHSKYVNTEPYSRLATCAKLQCLDAHNSDMACIPHVHTVPSLDKIYPGTDHSWLWELVDMKTTLVSHSIPRTQGRKDLCVRAYTHTPHTHTQKLGWRRQNTIWWDAGISSSVYNEMSKHFRWWRRKNGHGCHLLISGVWILFVFGACQSSSEKNKIKRNNSLFRHFDSFSSFTAKWLTLQISAWMTQINEGLGEGRR